MNSPVMLPDPIQTNNKLAFVPIGAAIGIGALGATVAALNSGANSNSKTSKYAKDVQKYEQIARAQQRGQPIDGEQQRFLNRFRAETEKRVKDIINKPSPTQPDQPQPTRPTPKQTTSYSLPSNSLDYATQMAKRNMNNKRRSRTSSKKLTPAASVGNVYRNLTSAKVRSVPGGTIVCNSESANIITTVATGIFGNTRTACAPSTIAWLSGIARNYSKWRWNKLRVIYIPQVSTATNGNLCMSAAYDAIDTTPTTIGQLQAAYKSVSAPLWGGYDGAPLLNNDNFMRMPGGAVAFDLDVTRFALPWYTYSSTSFNAGNSSDDNQYCPAWINLGTGGGPALATAVGTLFFKYEIELIEPINATLNA